MNKNYFFLVSELEIKTFPLISISSVATDFRTHGWLYPFPRSASTAHAVNLRLWMKLSYSCAIRLRIFGTALTSSFRWTRWVVHFWIVTCLLFPSIRIFFLGIFAPSPLSCSTSSPSRFRVRWRVYWVILDTGSELILKNEPSSWWFRSFTSFLVLNLVDDCWHQVVPFSW